MFSKYIYLASLTSYYTFYLIHHFNVPVTSAQIYLFVFLGAVAAGTLGGGPVGDRLGFKTVIWVSILGVLPFTLVLPHVNLFWTAVLTVPIGLILASAFSAIIVFAQELLRIAQPANACVLGQNDGGRDNAAEEGAPANFVYSGDAGEALGARCLLVFIAADEGAEHAHLSGGGG